MADGPVPRLYDLLAAEDDGRVCKDIPESLCDEQPRHFLVHVVSLTSTKLGDGLSDPKLILSWLLGALGAPGFVIGLLVPLREAGSLLPQLVIADWVRGRPLRKWVWVGGSLVQGVAVGCMAGSVWLLPGRVAVWVIVGCLAVFAVARSFCSVSYKDVLGKTISKATRGTTTGTAATVSAALVFGYGLLLSLDIMERSTHLIAIGLLIAAGLWLLASVVFTTLKEVPGATGGGSNPLRMAAEQIGLLRSDAQLRWFILTRGLLTATALAPPYMVSLVHGENGSGSSELGLFVLASALASVLSTYIWGRLSDKSSRRVLMYAGLAAGVVLLGNAALAWGVPTMITRAGVLPAGLFLLMIAYQGVRLGRSTHLVDMADADTRAPYTAISNTAIGVLLLVATVFGTVAQVFGTAPVLGLFAVMSLAGGLSAARLHEVQDR